MNINGLLSFKISAEALAISLCKIKILAICFAIYSTCRRKTSENNSKNRGKELEVLCFTFLTPYVKWHSVS